MRDFRKLNIWNNSMELVPKIYELAKQLPDNEKFGLYSQMTWAAISIPSNISEGCSRDTDKGFKNYISIAIGSSFELETQLEIVKRNFEINKLKIDNIIEELHQLQKMMNALKSKLKPNN